MEWTEEEDGSLYLSTPFCLFARVDGDDHDGCEWSIYETPVFGPQVEHDGQARLDMRDGGDSRNAQVAVGWARDRAFAKYAAMAMVLAMGRVITGEVKP